MAAQTLHRGRLIDHLHLVVSDVKASRTFYGALFDALGVPIGGEAEDYFWADELFISMATVKTHVRHVFAKLDLRDRAHAVIVAREAGLTAG